MSRAWTWKVFQSGMEVASGSAPCEADAKREAMHYGVMYAQDGPPALVKIKPPRRSPPIGAA